MNLLEKQHYEFAGEHTAVKVCSWTKKSLRDEGFCYKEQFYNIKSHLCCQMSPAINFCSHSCTFCWRPLEFNLGFKFNAQDKPKNIIDNCIKAQRKKISGFLGNKKINKDKFKQAQNPKHFALSLSGDATFYEFLPQLIQEIHNKGMTSFLVTNGTNPEMLKKLLDEKAQPTQMYITLPAPDEEIYTKTCSPLIKDGWKKINSSLELLCKFKRNAVRLTLVRNLNMINPEKYGALIKKFKPLFVEVKAYMAVGYSRERLGLEYMPRHHEIVEFAEKICKHSGETDSSRYKIIDEKELSRVELLMKEDFDDRKMEF